MLTPNDASNANAKATEQPNAKKPTTPAQTVETVTEPRNANLPQSAVSTAADPTSTPAKNSTLITEPRTTAVTAT